MEIGFRTLTPLWTGGAGRNSDQARETGLIGSMRWWYEAILRGLGGQVCDPMGDDRCEFNAKSDCPPEEQLCPACWLFGCTGWQRRFRLRVDGLHPQDLFFVASSSVYSAAGNWLWRVFGGEELGGTKNGHGSDTIFTFGVQALWSEQAKLRIEPLDAAAEGVLARIAFLLHTIAHWGALGAKSQHGFGQIQIMSGLGAAQTDDGRKLVIDDARNKPSVPLSPGMFDLGHSFSHVYQLAQPNPYQDTGIEIGSPPQGFVYRHHFIPCAFDIRYKSKSRNYRTGQGQDFGMRPWFRRQWGQEAAHRLCGCSDAHSDEQRSAGRIFVSHLYRTQPSGPWQLKVWGHVPTDLKDVGGNSISLSDVTSQVAAFVSAMFPKSQLVVEFNRKEVLGR
ncbi:MAG: type III-B CRISPR module RAMP protein Cmr1 [Anaerolineae bacterium]|nr:type III-B CRISPR module RAMP protein Cmr1 [Anaerolineae bacterium]